jgi:hypothetical protein
MMRRHETRLGQLEAAVRRAVRDELRTFLDRLEAELDRQTYERVLEIAAGMERPSPRRRVSRPSVP